MSTTARAARLDAPALTRSPPVQWPVLIGELQDAGLSLRQIGEALGVAHTTVNAWCKPVMRNGELRPPAAPTYEDGKALLELHALLQDQIDASKRSRHGRS